MDNLHKALLDATSDNALILDTEGRVLAANEPICKRLGIPAAHLLGSTIFDLFPPDQADRRRIVLENVVRSGQPFRLEDTTSSGAVFEACVHPVVENGGLVECLVVCVRDVTAPKRAEEQRIRLATAIEQAVEAIIILNNDLCVEYVNQSFEEMTGYAQIEIKGLNINALSPAPEQQAVFNAMVAALARDESWAGRTEHTRKDGAVFHCEQTIARIRGKRFLPLGYVSVWRDVTETMHLEKQLRQAQKMEAIGTLAGGIAHDFNNILGPIILHAELRLMGMDDDDSDPSRQSFEEILNAANRAKNLVDQILGLSRRREHDKPVPFQLASIIKECLKLLRPSLPPSISIRLDNRAGNDLILADPTQIHQVIMNLCTNAAQAMGAGPGELVISLDNRESPPKASARAARSGPCVCMTVRDTGCGIAPEDLERIFDPFFTTKQDSMGTGLGLAVVQTIVAALGGCLHVTSDPGKGSAFEVCLPESTKPAETQATEQPLHTGAPHGHILFVDDDAMLVQGGCEALRQLGYTVTDCRNGFEALALFRQDPESFDLVLADVTMPELNGVDLAKELLLSRPDLPVVLCSGYTDLVLPDRTEALGIRAFLRKPFHLDELAATLEMLLRKRPR